MRVVAGAALGALGLAAVVASGHASGVTGFSLATLGAAEGSQEAFATADAVRRNAAAQATLAKQTALNAKTAAEEAEATYAAAQADAEKLDRLAAQAMRSYELASVDDRDAADAATIGTQQTEDDALEEDAELSALTATYTAAREEYQASTEALVTLTKAKAAATAATRKAEATYAEASKTAEASKKAADTAHVSAAKANQDAQRAEEVGEEKPEQAIARAKSVADKSSAAKAAEIAAGKDARVAADALAALESAKLVEKTATETLDIEQARNAELSAASTEAEARMIDQSDLAAKAKTAAADLTQTSVGAYFDASVTKAEMKDKADKAAEAAKRAEAIAATRAEESKAAQQKARAASDASDVAEAELVLAERTLEVEEKKMLAIKNAEDAAAEAKAEVTEREPAEAKAKTQTM